MLIRAMYSIVAQVEYMYIHTYLVAADTVHWIYSLKITSRKRFLIHELVIPII